MKWIVCALAGSLLSAAPAHAAEGGAEGGPLWETIGSPDDLSISASVRVRYEALGGQFRPGYDRGDDIVVLRTTLFAEYDTGPVRIGGELIDARAYDTDTGSPVGTGVVNAMELVQAYLGFDLGDTLGKGSATTVDVGRFTMDIRSRRLVARSNFRNTTNAFAGVKLHYSGHGKHALTLFYTLPLVRKPADKASILDNKVEWDRESFDLRFWGAALTRPLGASRATVEGYFFGLDERDAPDLATRNRHLRTAGARLVRKAASGKADFDIEAAYQWGRTRAGTAADAERLDVAAHMLHAELGYSFASPARIRVAAVYDEASGDGSADSYGRFDTLFGARRGEFGPTGIYGALGRANIRSPGLRIAARPDPRWDAMAMYRAAWLASATDSFASTGVRDPSGSSGTFAGQQIEIRARYWLVPDLLRLEAGGVVLFDGGFLKDAPNATGYGDTRYGYLELSATF